MESTTSRKDQLVSRGTLSLKVVLPGAMRRKRHNRRGAFSTMIYSIRLTLLSLDSGFKDFGKLWRQHLSLASLPRVSRLCHLFPQLTCAYLGPHGEVSSNGRMLPQQPMRRNRECSKSPPNSTLPRILSDWSNSGQYLDNTLAPQSPRPRKKSKKRRSIPT